MQNRSLNVLFAGLHVGRGDFAPHHHQVWELIYVSNGAVITVQDCHPFSLSAGMVLVNPPNVVHEDRYVRPYELIYLFVNGTLLESISQHCFWDEDGGMGRVFEAILREWNSDRSEREVMLAALAKQLEILVVRGQANRTRAKDQILVEAERRLRSSIADPVTLDELASQLGVSRSWLHAEFSRAHRKSPHEFVAALRMEKALALLRHSSHKISTIAQECGFASGSHLTNAVRKATGYSPSEIRLASQNGVFTKTVPDVGTTG